MKKTQKRSFYFNKVVKDILFLTLIVVIGFVIFRVQTNKFNMEKSNVFPPEIVSTNSDTHMPLTTFQSSDNLDFTVEVPEGFDAVERFNTVTFTNQLGEVISVDRNGTNYTNIADYIHNHRNGIEKRLIDREEIRIGDLEAIIGLLDETKHVFIFADYRVYTISTDDSELYDDLITIAHSFRYTGAK